MDQDDDIEIDISDYPIAFELTDDEQMVEDGEQARPDTATDENMDDDEPTIITHEEVMIDEPPLDNTTIGDDLDDELIDYDDDQAQQIPAPVIDQGQIQPATLEMAVAPFLVSTSESQTTLIGNPLSSSAEETSGLVPVLLSNGPSSQVEQQSLVAEESIAAPLSSSEHQEPIPATVDGVHNDKAPVEGKLTVKDIDPPTTVQEQVKNDEISAQQLQTEQNDEASDHTQQAEVDYEKSLTEKQSSTIETRIEPSEETLPPPTDTGLHPVMVKYRSTEFPLFKSQTSPNGLLENDNIASLSLANLMATCREQLAINTGENISDDQELCLKIDHMRSTLREHEPRAFEFSLQEVLDTFVHLYQNDATEEIPAMWLTIELIWNFSKLITEMKSAASEGLGMTHFEYVNSANGDYYQEEHPNEDEPDHASIDNEYYEPDEEYADEFEEEQAADHNGESQHHNELQDNAESASSNANPNNDNVDEVVAESSVSEAQVEDSQADAETDVESSKPPIEDSHDYPAAALATSTEDANDSAYAASNVEGHPGHPDNRVPSHEDTTEEQSDNEFDDAAEVYDAVGDEDFVTGEIEEAHEDDDHLEPKVNGEEVEEGAEQALLPGNDEADDNTLHDELDNAAVEQEEYANEDNIQNMPEPEEAVVPASGAAPTNDDLLEYDDDENAPLDTSTEQSTSEKNGDGTEHAEADASKTDSDPEGRSLLHNQTSKHESPRGKRRLEDNSDFDFIDFADDEPDVKKARAG
jgi:hypothetical protein